MRSLEEWQAYVEQQIEAAKRRKNGDRETSQESPKGEKSAPASSQPTATRETPSPERPQVRTAVAPAPRPPRADSRLPEGRALLSWEDTSPLPKTAANTPPPSPIPSVHDRLAPSEGTNAFAERLGLTESSVSDDEDAGETTLASAAATSPPPAVESEQRVIPLKPYQPRDPRWQSSVSPPRLRVDLVPDRKNSAEISSPIVPVEESKEETVSPAPESLPVIDESGFLPMEGVTGAVTANGLHEAGASEEKDTAPKAPVKRAKRLTAKRAEAVAVPAESPEQIRALWDRVPRHVQALIRTHNDEVAQRSYKDFRESREDLIYRLLDPELSLEEAARILAVCPTTVRRYTNRGLLSHHRTPGNQRRFRLSHVLEFMERYGQTLEIDARRERENSPEGETTEESSRTEEVTSDGEGSVTAPLPS